MLFDAIVTSDFDRESMRAVLARRVRYLQNRATQLAERRVSVGDSDAWQTTMGHASLCLELAEGAAALGNIEDARFAIRLAVPDLVQLRMPYGAALQRAFVADHPGLAGETNALVREWGVMFERRSAGDGEAAGDFSSASRVANAPQQWAYYGLTPMMSRELSTPYDAPIEQLRAVLIQWLLVPVGRMRFPMDHYLYVIEYCEAARLDQSDVGARAPVVVDILTKQLVALFRALQYASVNRYLWTRLLSPAPWFDFDVALLIAAVLEAPGKLSRDLGRAVASAVPSDVANYAAEFVASVEQLRQPR